MDQDDAGAQLVVASIGISKAYGIAEVDAVASLIGPLLEEHWEKVMGEALRIATGRLDSFVDDNPAPDVDLLAAAPEESHDGILFDLVATILAVYWAAASTPLPPSAQRAMTEGSRRLLAAGSASAGGSLDFGRTAAGTAAAAAQVDAALLMAARVTEHRGELTALTRSFLTTRTTRIGEGRVVWLAAMQEALGLVGRPWLSPLADVWAYRWYNVGAFLRATQDGGTATELIAFNNPPFGPDGRTTSFCRWVHGRTVSVTRAALQVDRYVSAALASDVEAMIRAWPLLGASARSGSSADHRLVFMRAGLPPYHWGPCRTRVFASEFNPG